MTAACSLPFNLSEVISRFRGGGGDSGADTLKLAAEYQTDVDALSALTRGMTIPSHLFDESQPRAADDFDPNQLLIPLDHLSLEPGYTLDYFYHVDGLGAYPLLYARDESAAPFESEEAYEAACYPADGSEPCEPYRHLVTDGTEAGYFQLVLMLVMGDQFYLDWHAGYNDMEIVASPARLETLIEAIGANDFGYSLTNAQKRAARRIDPTPIVEIGEAEVKVSVLGLYQMGGFNR